MLTLPEEWGKTFKGLTFMVYHFTVAIDRYIKSIYVLCYIIV